MKNDLKGLFFYEIDSCGWLLADLYETDDEIVFEVDLPGMEPDNISVRSCEDLLVIEGVRSETYDETRIKYLCMERGAKDFRRVFNIPVSVNNLGGKATYSKGVVTIRFEKLKGKLADIKVERIDV